MSDSDSSSASLKEKRRLRVLAQQGNRLARIMGADIPENSLPESLSTEAVQDVVVKKIEEALPPDVLAAAKTVESYSKSPAVAANCAQALHVASEAEKLLAKAKSIEAAVHSLSAQVQAKGTALATSAARSVLERTGVTASVEQIAADVDRRIRATHNEVRDRVQRELLTSETDEEYLAASIGDGGDGLRHRNVHSDATGKDTTADDAAGAARDSKLSPAVPEVHERTRTISASRPIPTQPSASRSLLRLNLMLLVVRIRHVFVAYLVILSAIAHARWHYSDSVSTTSQSSVFNADMSCVNRIGESTPFLDSIGGWESLGNAIATSAASFPSCVGSIHSSLFSSLLPASFFSTCESFAKDFIVADAIWSLMWLIWGLVLQARRGILLAIPAGLVREVKVLIQHYAFFVVVHFSVRDLWGILRFVF